VTMTPLMNFSRILYFQIFLADILVSLHILGENIQLSYFKIFVRLRRGFSAQPAIGANVLENGTYDSKNYNCIPESMS
jgi:hypothetical protein